MSSPQVPWVVSPAGTMTPPFLTSRGAASCRFQLPGLDSSLSSPQSSRGVSGHAGARTWLGASGVPPSPPSPTSHGPTALAFPHLTVESTTALHTLHSQMLSSTGVYFVSSTSGLSVTGLTPAEGWGAQQGHA